MQNTDKSFFFQAKTFKKFPFPGESMKDPGIECGFETLSTGVSVFSARAPDFSGFISLDECEGWISNFWKWVPSCEGWNLNEANEVNDWVVVSNIFYFHPYLGKWSNLTNIFQMGWKKTTNQMKNWNNTLETWKLRTKKLVAKLGRPDCLTMGFWRPLSWIFAGKTKASQHEGGYEGGGPKSWINGSQQKSPDTKKSATCHYPVRFSGIWRWVKQVAKRLVHAFLNNWQRSNTTFFGF